MDKPVPSSWGLMLARMTDAILELYGVYQALLSLAQQKQKLLTSSQSTYQELSDLTAQEEARRIEAAALEQTRLNLAAEIAAAMGIPATELTVTRMADQLGGEQAASLIAHAEALQAALVELRDQNAINRQLLEMKLSYTSFIVDALAQSRNSPTNFYGASGQEQSQEGEIHFMLDSEV